MPRRESIILVALLAWSSAFVWAADLQQETALLEADTLTSDSVIGILLKIDGEYFIIEGHDGEQLRVHVDETTDWEQVDVGDSVRAFLTRNGHVTTVQRIAE